MVHPCATSHPGEVPISGSAMDGGACEKWWRAKCALGWRAGGCRRERRRRAHREVRAFPNSMIAWVLGIRAIIEFAGGQPTGLHRPHRRAVRSWLGGEARGRCEGRAAPQWPGGGGAGPPRGDSAASAGSLSPHSELRGRINRRGGAGDPGLHSTAVTTFVMVFRGRAAPATLGVAQAR